MHGSRATLLYHSPFVTTGSFPESDGDKIYNTCTVFNPSGDMLGKYRKVST